MKSATHPVADALGPYRFGPRVAAPHGRLAFPVSEPLAAEAEAIVRTHAAIRAADSPWPARHVPAATLEGDGASRRLVFDCDPVMPLSHIVEWFLDASVGVPFPAGYAFADAILTTMARAHQATPPALVGALSWDHILVARDGRFWLTGWGIASQVEAARGRPGCVEAPEMTVGGPATVASDLYVGFSMCQSLVPYTETPKAFQDALMGRVTPGMTGVAAEIAESVGRALSRVPSVRPACLDDAIAQYRSEQGRLGIQPDHDGIRRFLGEQAQAILAERDLPTLRVVDGADTYLLPDGSRVELATRRALRLMMRRLVNAHRLGDGRVLSVDELSEAGWPDESISVESARRRAYVAISQLRKLGFDDAIQNRDGGYRLDPDLRVVMDVGALR